MVRIKERYLLVNIFYPSATSKGAKGAVPDFVAANQPTTDLLTPGILVRSLKTEIHALFGDFGAGAVERSLSGSCCHSRTFPNA
jgi:ribonuclease P/MRP protein subunit POP5